MDVLSQVMIAMFGGAAIWLVGRKESWHRWGYVLGLLSQPWWFYTTLTHQQYGMFILSLWYTYAWIQGICNYWWRPARTKDI